MPALSLADAVIVVPESSGRAGRAAALLSEEVAARTSIRWPIRSDWPDEGTPVVALGTSDAVEGFAGRYAASLASEPDLPGAEGFRIRTIADRPAPALLIVGTDARGVLFGAGRLLRSLEMRRGAVRLPEPLRLSTTPRYSLRGHQLGYRPKTNSYDGWDLAAWEQYYRDLILFGANAVELIPPRSDDDADSPHFPLPPMEMMVGMSRLADDYDLDVWIWYPAMDPDYADPATVDFALGEWGEVFARLPRVDHVFVPGGDPGHTHPVPLMALLEKQARVLRAAHPRAGMWVAPQGFNQEWLEIFIGLLRREPEWLTGVVFGPQIRVSLPELRAMVPARYPIRHYPDITHSLRCQYPVPEWDAAFALTEGREGINPRPRGQARIFRLLSEHTIGFVTYSEGCNDDVNKAVWSALGWDPDVDVVEVLRQYARCFIDPDLAEGFAQGLLALERNWEGPLAVNDAVATTLLQFQAMERAASPRVLLNWRFQQALYRAYFDAYARARLLHETALEEQAMEQLPRAPAAGSLPAIARAEALLDRAAGPVAAEWRTRLFALAEALFQSIRMQLSVERYQAIAVGRGANLDTCDVPLGNAPWLRERFAAVRRMESEQERLRAIDRILRWSDPGPGGFYDDLGSHGGAPRLLTGPGFAEDPAFLGSALTGFAPRPGARLSSVRHAESLNDTPLRMGYEGLDPSARYRLRVLYGGEATRGKIRLEAGGLEVHPWIEKPAAQEPVEFPLPAEATRGGTLALAWRREPGLGGNGRGCQVAEVWLICEGRPPAAGEETG